MFLPCAVLEDDLSQSVKNGYLQLEDEIDHVSSYCHLCSTVKRERFFPRVYFSNVDSLVSYLPLLTNETVVVKSPD